jgi:hypothetical protein
MGVDIGKDFQMNRALHNTFYQRRLYGVFRSAIMLGQESEGRRKMGDGMDRIARGGDVCDVISGFLFRWFLAIEISC